MSTETDAATIPESIIEETAEIVQKVTHHGDVIISGLYLLVGAVLIIMALHFLTRRFVYPYTGKGRRIRVVSATVYLFILVVVGVLTLDAIGIDVSIIGKLALWGVLIVGVIAFLLAPLFPRMPFVPGHIVDISGVLGTVDAISTYHTTVRKFDGTMVFIPNAAVLASRISNFSDTPTRRAEFKLSVNTDCDLQRAKSLVVGVMTADERVRTEPAPGVFITSVQASGTDLFAFCWVENADWFKVRSDIWLNLVDAFMKDDSVELSLPQQEVYVKDGHSTGSQG